MELEELKHEINMGTTKFMRKYGKHPNILVLGKNEYDVLKKNCKENIDGWSADKVWSMEVRVDENSDSCIRMMRKKPDIFSYEKDLFLPYRMKIDVLVPLKFKEDFKLFIVKQHGDDVGIQIFAARSNDLQKKDFTRFQLHICGKTKGLAIAWSEYLFEIERILNYGLKKEDDQVVSNWGFEVLKVI